MWKSFESSLSSFWWDGGKKIQKNYLMDKTILQILSATVSNNNIDIFYYDDFLEKYYIE